MNKTFFVKINILKLIFLLLTFNNSVLTFGEGIEVSLIKDTIKIVQPLFNPNPTTFLNELTGEYELKLITEIPFNDILQIIIRNELEHLFLDVIGQAGGIELEPKNIQELTFKGLDKDGSILYEPNKSFDVTFKFDSATNTFSCRIYNDELSYGGYQILSCAERGKLIHSDLDETLTEFEAVHDFNQLRRIIEQVHPAQYIFTSKDKFDSLFLAQEKKIGKEMNNHDFYGVIAPLVAAIGCGHASVELPESYMNGTNIGFFPLRLYITESNAYVVQTLDSNIPAGCEILSIDGIKISEIIWQLKKCITSDGLFESTLQYRLNQNFQKLYASVYGHKAIFNVVLRISKSNNTQAITIKGIGNNELKKLFPKRPGNTSMERHLNFEILSEYNTAILTIHSFGFYDDNNGFNQFIDSAFNSIQSRKIENLILDLRDNDGGDPLCSAYLLKYLSSNPIPYFLKKYGEHYASLALPHIPAKQPFKGRVWILIDGGCLSSTTHLCALLKYHQIGKFAGTETAGNYTCNDNSKTFVLSCSGIRVTLARGTYSVAVVGMPLDRGIIPDIELEPKLDDLLNGNDTVKETVLMSIIKNEN